MSAVVVDPTQQSGRPRKKKAKSEAAAQSTPQPPEAEVGNGSADAITNGTDGASGNPYIKEIQKNIRNLRKKLSATQKVDSIIAENPGVSLDELLSSRKINADQKAQAQKKPSLQASLAQYEEQHAQYQQFDEEYQKRIAAEKSALETSHKDEIEKVRDATVADAQAESKKQSKDNLLILSKFLRAAAAKRQGGDESSPENRAFEGALLLVYGGETGAVTAMEKLISGSEELVPTVDSTPSEFTFKQVKALSSEYAPYSAEEAWAEEVAQSEPTPPTAETDNSLAPITTDPTIAHATLIEKEAEGEPDPNINSHPADTPTIPEASNIDAGAANAAAESNWGVKDSVGTETGPDGWTEIPRDPAETDTGIQATPAAISNTQSWAEDVPTETPPAFAGAPDTPATNIGDGFHEVHHGRGRGRGDSRGGGRGGRGRGGDRGAEGHRGRGGYRGDRGGGEGAHRSRGRGGRGNRGRGDATQ